MTIRPVSENSEAEIIRAEALREVEFVLRELAANMLRVIRGAGRPHALAEQAEHFAEVVAGFRRVCGTYPSTEEFTAMLDPEKARIEYRSLAADRVPDDRERAMITMHRASLQIIASTLLDQYPQLARGREDFMDGFSQLEAMREEVRLRSQPVFLHVSRDRGGKPAGRKKRATKKSPEEDPPAQD